MIRPYDVAVVVLSGRVHLYEGHFANVVVHAVRVMRLWGASVLVLTNASFQPHRLMVITDHINLTGTNPFSGKLDSRWGIPQFPDLTQIYDYELSLILRVALHELEIQFCKGVYAGLAEGPLMHQDVVDAIQVGMKQ
ncbi:MAG: hypothetical protein Q8P90_05595 [bacterium]|nr:hypothetical protein [bacterium]